jgi:hypothetical protein
MTQQVTQPEEKTMNQTTMESCPEAPESGVKKTGKIICGSCIMIAAAVPVVLVIVWVLAKFFGHL